MGYPELTAEEAVELLSSEKPIGNVHLVATGILDMFMYVAFCAPGFRDFSKPVTMLIAHYFTWHLITDIVAYFIPQTRRCWYYPFRAIGAFQMVQVTVWFWWAGVDGTQKESIIRLVSAALVMIHSVVMVVIFGPKRLTQLHAFIDYAYVMFWKAPWLPGKFHIMPLPMGLATIFSGEMMYRLHYNYNISGLDAQLSSFQAGNGVTVLIKLWAFQILVKDWGKRCITGFLVFALFAAQWPLMPEAFTKAPIPVFHVAAEITFLTDFICSLYCFMKGTSTKVVITE
eukprot:TRINITY_DN4017_c0_g1_i1.p1 TRINITY_DN4017_c0_g1~~TRINITY_DN4017_c0_g1_i1.p1  ORF type:complete len:305 (+),score=40.26 TRINITY_DN4017_c0_g1_i1:61-915(+)